MGLAETAELAVNLSVKGNFNQAMGQAQAALGKTSKAATGLRGIVADPRLKDSILTGVGLGGGMLGFQAVAMGISTTIDVLSDSIRMAAEEEAAIAQLTRAIEENDAAWDGNIDAIEAVIDARQALAFADEEQRDSLQRLVTVTGDVTKALELQLTAMDLARGRGMDLATASDLIGKVFAGNLSTLSRYGIVLRKGATATEALAEIQRRYAGQTEAFADSTQGKFLQAQIALNNAMEELGALLLPAAADMAGLAAALLRDMGKAIGELTGHVDRAVDLFEGLRDTVHETVGRDIENDIMNLSRIGVTGGLSLVGDAAGNMGFAFEDAGRFVGDFINGPMMLYETEAKELAFVTQGTTRSLEGLAAAAEDAGPSLDDLMADADALSTAQAKAASQAKKLEAALESMASTSLADVRGEFQSVMKAAEQAAKDNTWAALNKHFKDLQEARRRFARQGEFDAVAILDAALLENREQVRQRRLASLAYRADAGDRKAIHQLQKQGITITRDAAGNMVRANQDQQAALQDTKGDIDDLIQRIRALQKAAAEGAETSITVDDSELDAVEARIRALTGWKVPPPSNPPPSLPPPSGDSSSGSSGGRNSSQFGFTSGHIFVDNRVEVAASQVDNQTRKVRRTNRNRSD